MRCPGCQFVSSDTWDVCPKCFVDLRPHKKASGLPVYEPNASYEALAINAGAPSAALKRPKASEQSSSFFSALFRKPEPQAEDRVTQEPPVSKDTAIEQSLDKAKIDQSVPISASSIVAAVLDASRIETEKLVRVAPPPAPAIPPLDDDGSAPVEAPPPEIEEFDIVFETAEAEIPAPTVGEAIIVSAAPSADSGAAPPSLQRHSQTALDMGDSNTVNFLFDETYSELGALGVESTIELTSESLIEVDTDKLTLALFDFAYEVVQNPERENLLAEKFTTSDERQVEAQDLSKELAHVEKRLALPVFGLKSLQARVASARQRESAEPVVELQIAKAGQQMLSAAIDMLTIAGLSLVLSALAIMSTDKALFARLSDISEATKADAISFLSVALAIALILIVVYPLGCLSFFRKKTLGQHFCKLRVVTELGRRIRTAHTIVRCLTFPLSCLCFGYIPVLLKGRSLHDALARTKICRDAES